MNRFPSRPSRSARRNAEIWALTFSGSTNVFGQTRAINSCLLTSSLGRSSKTFSIASARLPRGTGLSPCSRRRCVGSNRKDPNEISLGVATADWFLNNGWSVSGLWTPRVASKLESEWNRSSGIRVAGNFAKISAAVAILRSLCLSGDPVCEPPFCRRSSQNRSMRWLTSNLPNYAQDGLWSKTIPDSWKGYIRPNYRWFAANQSLSLSNRSAPRVVTLRSDYLNEQWACSADDRAGKYLVHALERCLNS